MNPEKPLQPLSAKVIPAEAVAEEIRAEENVRAGDGDGGTAEVRLLSRGLSARDLERESEETEHDRAERFKGHFESISICAIWAISIVVALFGLIWFWHLVTPDSWHWLKDPQIEKLQNIFAGIVLAGMLGDHFKKRLG